MRVAADLHAGRTPRPRADAGLPTVKDLANKYLAGQNRKIVDGSIDANWFEECVKVAQGFAAFVGKHRTWDDLTPDDFAAYRSDLYRRYKPPTITRRITIVKAIFKHAYQNALIDHEMRYGDKFTKPCKRTMRRHQGAVKRENGAKLFEANEIQRMLSIARPQLRAMILLAINGGYGASDCASLPIMAVDLDAARIGYERPKTGIEREVPLWPETASALFAVLNGKRPPPSRPEYEELVFLTVRGNPWKTATVLTGEPANVVRLPETQTPKVKRQDPISQQFSKLQDLLGIRRPGRGFYALRHTFRTWADETRDQHAIYRIMGHALPGMSEYYVQAIAPERLRAVADCVRAKLFG